MSLLSICQRTARLLSLPVPATVVSSQDTQVQLLYELANEAGEEMTAKFDWQQLMKEFDFTTLNQAEQTGAVPADLARTLANSFFDRTTRRELIGPITPQQWQAIEAQPTLNRVFLAYRQRDGEFLITPDPTAGDGVFYEYISKNWAVSAVGVAQDSFLADTDTSLLPERLFRLSIRWRFRKTKGLDYAEDLRTYEEQLQIETAVNGSMGKLDSTGRTAYNYYPNIPIGDFPGP